MTQSGNRTVSATVNGNLPRRLLVLAMTLSIAVATACSGQEPPVKVRSRLKTAVELRIDPRTLSPARLMNRVQLPDP
ncbi:MAG: hypothetical protein ACREVY_00005, partial [Gammaproteobacteria bacterium]